MPVCFVSQQFVLFFWRDRKQLSAVSTNSAPWHNPVCSDWIRGDGIKRKTEKSTRRRRRRKYLSEKSSLYLLLSKHVQRGEKPTGVPTLCSQSPWKQWALLIRPIPLSRVNSPRQHGAYHCSCIRGGEEEEEEAGEACLQLQGRPTSELLFVFNPLLLLLPFTLQPISAPAPPQQGGMEEGGGGCGGHLGRWTGITFPSGWLDPGPWLCS